MKKVSDFLSFRMNVSLDDEDRFLACKLIDKIKNMPVDDISVESVETKFTVYDLECPLQLEDLVKVVKGVDVPRGMLFYSASYIHWDTLMEVLEKTHPIELARKVYSEALFKVELPKMLAACGLEFFTMLGDKGHKFRCRNPEPEDYQNGAVYLFYSNPTRSGDVELVEIGGVTYSTSWEQAEND